MQFGFAVNQIPDRFFELYSSENQTAIAMGEDGFLTTLGEVDSLPASAGAEHSGAGVRFIRFS